MWTPKKLFQWLGATTALSTTLAVGPFANAMSASAATSFSPAQSTNQTAPDSSRVTAKQFDKSIDNANDLMNKGHYGQAFDALQSLSGSALAQKAEQQQHLLTAVHRLVRQRPYLAGSWASGLALKLAAQWNGQPAKTTSDDTPRIRHLAAAELASKWGHAAVGQGDAVNGNASAASADEALTVYHFNAGNLAEGRQYAHQAVGDLQNLRDSGFDAPSTQLNREQRMETMFRALRIMLMTLPHDPSNLARNGVATIFQAQQIQVDYSEMFTKDGVTDSQEVPPAFAHLTNLVEQYVKGLKTGLVTGSFREFATEMGQPDITRHVSPKDLVQRLDHIPFDKQPVDCSTDQPTLPFDNRVLEDLSTGEFRWLHDNVAATALDHIQFDNDAAAGRRYADDLFRQATRTTDVADPRWGNQVADIRLLDVEKAAEALRTYECVAQASNKPSDYIRWSQKLQQLALNAYQHNQAKVGQALMDRADQALQNINPIKQFAPAQVSLDTWYTAQLQFFMDKIRANPFDEKSIEGAVGAAVSLGQWQSGTQLKTPKDEIWNDITSWAFAMVSGDVPMGTRYSTWHAMKRTSAAIEGQDRDGGARTVGEVQGNFPAAGKLGISLTMLSQQSASVQTL
jgi:hypothetical protein